VEQKEYPNLISMNATWYDTYRAGFQGQSEKLPFPVSVNVEKARVVLLKAENM
jgi:hypothetical protein